MKHYYEFRPLLPPDFSYNEWLENCWIKLNFILCNMQVQRFQMHFCECSSYWNKPGCNPNGSALKKTNNHHPSYLNKQPTPSHSQSKPTNQDDIWSIILEILPHKSSLGLLAEQEEFKQISEVQREYLNREIAKFKVL